MRFTLLLASSALAASLVLSGCSTSGGSQAIPGGTQTSMGRHAAFEAHVVGMKHDTSCPSSFYECVEVSTSSPSSQEWCIVYSGTSDCSDLYPGTWTWTSENNKVKKGNPGKKTKKIKSSWSPNPGNPSTLTISVAKKAKNTKGKIKYAVQWEACNSASSCLGPIVIGVSVD